ncbi:DUF4071 domain-containing protein [Bacillus sp. F19]|nr:DUF4071 domain-containing protein [Bacillus sp. F19]
MSGKGTCFVIMGYGVKTDLSTGRELNLDKTYKNIIKPAALEAGLECIRADEIKHSGTIDVPMYRHLITADVVIADLSTSNPNAFYELGVRHALRPKTTISIAESELKPPFDVSHTVIRQYEHLGKDIGVDEAFRFKKELVDAINTILTTEEIDSPVYTYLKELEPPRFGLESETTSKEKRIENLGNIIETANIFFSKNDFHAAKCVLEHAAQIDPNNDYILQKLTLATYKSKLPNHVDALNEALGFLERLNIDITTDPESLGLAGAIYKRLWEEVGEIDYLNKSIFYYEKGFYIRNDYYNGINLAYLYNVRANNNSKMNNKHESIADFIIANRIRQKVIDICEALFVQDSFKERSDKYWIVATMEEAYYGLGNINKYKEFSEVARTLSNVEWERETTKIQISKIKKLIDNLQI